MMSSKLVVVFLLIFTNDVLSEKCTNPLPFMEYLKYGYDLAEFDIYGCPDIGGKRAIISEQAECSKGRKFKLKDKEQTEYQIPDEIATLQNFSHESFLSPRLLKRFPSYFEDYIHDRVYIQPKYRIEGTDYFLYRKTDYYKEIRKLFDSNDQVGIVPWYLSRIYSATHSLTVHTKFISPTFLSEANKLPSNFTGNEGKFSEFITTYGTHYIHVAEFGGALQRITTLKRNVTEPSDIFNEVRKDSFALGSDLKILCAKHNGSRRIEKVFDSNRNFQQLMLGGFADHKLFKNRTIPMNEFEKFPALIAAEMIPISELLTKDGDKEKKESINKAIKIHLIRSTNEAYINIFNDYKKHVTPRDEANEVLKRYERSKGSQDENLLTNLNYDIEYELRDISEKLRRK